MWLAPGFAFAASEALVVGETRSDVPGVNPDGVESLRWSRGVVRDELMAALRAKRAFAAAVLRPEEASPGRRSLALETTVVEYDKGGGGARFWAGLYGAGQPAITVRGVMADGARPVFVFETRRSGVGAGARLLGGYRSDRDIRTNKIRDLASARSEFVASGGQ